MLQYVDRFIHMYGDLYPTRQRPFLKARNEGGTMKVVCTSLRPTMLPHPELLTLKGAADFVANFFTYEPLQQPSEPPAHLPSPSAVLSWQVMNPHNRPTHPRNGMARKVANALFRTGFNSLT